MVRSYGNHGVKRMGHITRILRKIKYAEMRSGRWRRKDCERCDAILSHQFVRRYKSWARGAGDSMRQFRGSGGRWVSIRAEDFSCVDAEARRVETGLT